MSQQHQLDFRAGNVNLVGVAGDTFSMTVKIEGISVIPDVEYRAQVRDGNGENPVEFQCDATSEGVVMTLYGDQTRLLSQLPSARRQQRVVGVGKNVTIWQGEYDLQIQHGKSLVRTLLYGTLELAVDVTR